MLFVRTFPELGTHARALTLSVVALNEMGAPLLYRLALVKAGEVGKRVVTPKEPDLRDDDAEEAELV